MAPLASLKLQRGVWFGILAVGLTLMTYMIVVESALGALPLLLVLLGLGGCCVSHYRLRKRGAR